MNSSSFSASQIELNDINLYKVLSFYYKNQLGLWITVMLLTILQYTYYS